MLKATQLVDGRVPTRFSYESFLCFESPCLADDLLEVKDPLSPLLWGFLPLALLTFGTTQSPQRGPSHVPYRALDSSPGLHPLDVSNHSLLQLQKMCAESVMCPPGDSTVQLRTAPMPCSRTFVQRIAKGTFQSLFTKGVGVCSFTFPFNKAGNETDTNLKQILIINLDLKRVS